MNVLDPFSLRREQLRGSNSNAGKMDQTWSMTEALSHRQVYGIGFENKGTDWLSLCGFIFRSDLSSTLGGLQSSINYTFLLVEVVDTGLLTT